MDDLTRIFAEGKCGCFACEIDALPDPAPDIDDDLPGEVRYGSKRWHAMMDAIADDRIDFMVSDPDDLNECISEYDLLAGDGPFAEDCEWWAAQTREAPAAYELAMAVREANDAAEQANGYADPEYRTWATDFDRRQFEGGMDREQPGEDGPEYDEDVEMRGHRAGTEF